MTSNAPVQTLNIQLNASAFEQVCLLGKKHRKTLGFFPQGAFEEYALEGCILIHLDAAGTVDGYLAFRYSGASRHVRLTHLCVRDDRRGQGIARALVLHLVSKTQHALGIGLWCREDFPASRLWPTLEFTPLGRKPGRGKAEAELVFWWRENGHPTLFSAQDHAASPEYVESSEIRAVLDANIIFDLDAPKNASDRVYHEESKALLADWLRPLVEYRVSGELFSEIHRQDDPVIQRRSQKAADRFQRVTANMDQVRTCAEELRAHLSWSSDPNTVSDARHLAYTSLSRHRYFITRDQRVIDAAAEIEQQLGVLVLRPTDFILRIDELAHEDQYRPLQVGDTRFRVRRLTEADRADLYRTFRHHLSGERKKDFEQRLTQRLSQPNVHHNSLYESNAGKALVMLSTAALPWALQVEFFRSVKDPLTLLLTRYALQRVILAGAFKQGKVATLCTDNEPSDAARQALQETGFLQEAPERWLKLNPALIGPPAAVAQELRVIGRQHPAMMEAAEQMALSVEEALEQLPGELLPQIEKALWPTKLLHDTLANFILPIKPAWARKLFDEEIPGLFGDHERLLLNWQNVFYTKAPRQHRLKPGSRILWYVSSQQGHQVSALRACSTVEEVRTGTARELHAAFHRLGVYRQRDLLDLAGDPGHPLTAIRFSRTELFSHSLPFRRVQALRATLGQKANNFQGPLHISSEEFELLYSAGHGRHA